MAFIAVMERIPFVSGLHKTVLQLVDLIQCHGSTELEGRCERSTPQ
jgi:uncharacterized membrane protein